MERISIGKITEQDFDGIMEQAGGIRLTTEATADYQLGNAIIELKFVEEEGFHKTERQEKISDLFKPLHAEWPVIPILPSKLNTELRRTYDRIIETPIKTHLRKADRQLKATANRLSTDPVRVAIILNVGYTAISPEEFEAICLKRTRNDTNNIDWLIIGGIYTYSDTFDHYFIARFQDFPIHLSQRFEQCDKLCECWGKWLTQRMEDLIRKGPPKDQMLPVVDIAFDVNGITYVKPSPAFPKSHFWPSGRKPRENSTGIDTCPPVGTTHVHFPEKVWTELKQLWPNERRLKNSYVEWISHVTSLDSEDEELRPYHALMLDESDLRSKLEVQDIPFSFDGLMQYSAIALGERVRPLVDEARDISKSQIETLEYILIEVFEIGDDEAFDHCSLYYCLDTPGFERTEAIFKHKRIFFHHALAVAASHAVKRNVQFVYFGKNRLFD